MPRTPGAPLARSAADLVAAANEVAPPLSLDEASALLDDESTSSSTSANPRSWSEKAPSPAPTALPRDA